MYRLTWRDHHNAVTVVGCGGTGGFVAEGLCRLLPKELDIILIDHDRVEEHNLRRQNFYQSDLDKFKSQALAERLSCLYGRKIGYSVTPYGSGETVHNGLLIGCVDNAAARQKMSAHSGYLWWIDSGNSEHSGQVLIGNTSNEDTLKQSFRDGRVSYLPLPSVQLPSLLVPVNETPRDCAQHEGQSPVINQTMSSLILHFVHRLLREELTWMGAYIDLKVGTLSTVPADPRTVARMMGMRERSLIRK